MLDRLRPKKIIVASSAPQIRYPDCYGIDMARLNDFIAFKAAIALLKETQQDHIINDVYKKSKAQEHLPKEEVVNYVKAPYFINMKGLGLSEEEYPLVFSRIFNQPVTNTSMHVINYQRNKIYRERSDGYWEKWEYNEQGNKIYREDSEGHWEKWEYNTQGNPIYYENRNGEWYKQEYDDQGNKISFEDSEGEWEKSEYDIQGNQTYYENSYGWWEKREYDDQGNIIYIEDSDGYIKDNR